MKKSLLIIIGIVLLALGLRLYQLGNVPPSPDWDEAALGWNAYSIIQTGRDEYGKFLPVVLRSFDDYKPALYMYLSIPSVLLFGLTTFAVRFPSMIFGVLTVLGVYFLIKELLDKEKIALLSSFLLAISPWHIQFSRVAFETNVGLAFNVFAALFFLKGLKRPLFLSLSAVCAAGAIYVYQSEKVFTPLFMLMLTLIYHKELLRLPRKYLLTAFAVGIIVMSPMIYYIATNSKSLTRAEATLVFSDDNFLNRNVARLVADTEENNQISKLLDNRRVLYVISTASGYLSHFNFKWLFLEGDINRHHAPGMGILYLIEFPFILLGIYFLIFSQAIPKAYRKGVLFLFGWFLLAPLPASFTSGVPHAVRTLNFLPTFQVFSAVGMLGAYAFIKQHELLARRFKEVAVYHVLLILFASLFMLNFLYYLNQYFVQQNYFYSLDWQYGHKEAVEYVSTIEDRFEKIVVSNKEPLDQSHMFWLFYKKYPPHIYQEEAKNASGGFRENHAFGKYEFRPIEFGKEKKDGKTLYVGRPGDFPSAEQILKKIDYLNGQPAIYIVVK